MLRRGRKERLERAVIEQERVVEVVLRKLVEGSRVVVAQARREEGNEVVHVKSRASFGR